MLAVTLALAGACTLTACTAAGPTGPTEPAETDAATPDPTSTTGPSPSTPVLLPDASAAENLPFFTSVVDDVWATPDRAAGRAYIDALVAAGFDKAAMEVTHDTSTVGNAAESIQFSVRWQD